MASMAPAEEKRAMAEVMIERIIGDEVDEVSANLSGAGDRDVWCDVLRYEFPIEHLVDVGGSLHFDAVAAKFLCVCGGSTLTPWHVAGLRGADELLTMFVDRLQMAVDCRLPSSGATVLQLTCFAGHTDTVRILLDQLNAEVNRRDNYGWTALHYAAVEGHFDIVDLLLDRGVDVTARDDDGVTAAYRAHEGGYQQVLRLMQSTHCADDLLLTAKHSDGSCSRQQPLPEQLYATINKLAQIQDLNGDSRVRIDESDYDLASIGSIQKHCGALGVTDCLDPYATSCPHSDKVGYSTVTRVVREELRRLLQGDSELVGHFPAVDTESSHSKIPAGSRNKDYEEIGTLMEAIRQHDLASTTYDDGRMNGAVVSLPANPPPLPPPRLELSSAAVAASVHDVDSRKTAPVTSSPRLKFIGRPLVDKTAVIHLLTRIEQSSAELDALFTGLVEAGLRRPGDWQRLAHELPICKSAKLRRRISSIEARYRKDMKGQAAAALAEWRSYRGNNATLDELMRALRRCGLHEEMRFLESMSQESSV